MRTMTAALWTLFGLAVGGAQCLAGQRDISTYALRISGDGTVLVAACREGGVRAFALPGLTPLHQWKTTDLAMGVAIDERNRTILCATVPGAR